MSNGRYICRFVTQFGTECGRSCNRAEGCPRHAPKIIHTWLKCMVCDARTRRTSMKCTKCSRAEYAREWRARHKNDAAGNFITPEHSGSESDDAKTQVAPMSIITKTNRPRELRSEEGFDMVRAELIMKEQAHREAERKHTELMREHREAEQKHSELMQAHHEAAERALKAIAALGDRLAFGGLGSGSQRIEMPSSVGCG